MTLVGCWWSEDGSIAFFGDTVASGISAIDHEYWSPVGGELPIAQGEDAPQALVQKIVLLGEDAIMGWSGPMMAAIALTNALLDREEGLDPAHARQCLAAASQPKFSAFVACARDGARFLETTGDFERL